MPCTHQRLSLPCARTSSWKSPSTLWHWQRNLPYHQFLLDQLSLFFPNVSALQRSSLVTRFSLASADKWTSSLIRSQRCFLIQIWIQNIVVFYQVQADVVGYDFCWKQHLLSNIHVEQVGSYQGGRCLSWVLHKLSNNSLEDYPPIDLRSPSYAPKIELPIITLTWVGFSG